MPKSHYSIVFSLQVLLMFKDVENTLQSRSELEWKVTRGRTRLKEHTEAAQQVE